jgi:hypothetical protein
VKLRAAVAELLLRMERPNQQLTEQVARRAIAACAPLDGSSRTSPAHSGRNATLRSKAARTQALHANGRDRSEPIATLEQKPATALWSPRPAASHTKVGRER